MWAHGNTGEAPEFNNPPHKTFEKNLKSPAVALSK